MGIKEGFVQFVKDVNFLIVVILLIIIYFFGIGLTFVFSKLFGKSFLQTSKKGVNWEDLNLKEKNIEEFYKQF